MPQAKFDAHILIQLIQAIETGDTGQVAKQLSEYPHLAQAALQNESFSEAVAHQIYAGDTGIQVAAAALNVEIAATLLSTGANIGARNRRGAEALHYASDSGPMKTVWNPEAQKNVITFLIEAGANPNAVDKCGASPLHRAVRTRSMDAVLALLASGAATSIKNENGSTPLHLAVQNTGRGGSGTAECKAHQVRIIELLLKSGADPEEKDNKGKTVRQWIRDESIRSLFP